MKNLAGIVLCVFALAATLGAVPKPPASPLLPSTFAGWQAHEPPKLSTDPQVADPVNAAVLKEYGFQDFSTAAYTREEGRKLTLRAARFDDASGAYGAFTFYKTPEMLNEKIGDQASSLNTRVLFYRANVLIDAQFDRLSAMSAAELRELADGLPVPPANARNLPALPTYLPKQSYQKNTAKYVMGPAALQLVGSPLSPDLVRFDLGAEVVLGKYNSSAGDATLMVISYPTPQIAGDRVRALDAQYPAQPGSSASPVFYRRSGPIVVVVAGRLPESEARSLLASVNYDANVTWNENTFFTKRDNLANLLVNVIILCAIVVGLALVAGLAFGGLRVGFRRMRAALGGAQPEEVEFIALHLGDKAKGPSSQS
jgi:hypothetical protein